jgi:ligand-binding SRPBCC domain-containing protein
MAIYQLYQEQKVAVSINEIWDFISNPKNLMKITPGYMGFNITSKNLPERIYPGMMIEYKVSPLWNIDMTWLTEITHVKENEYFIDEQRVGPYKIWHHEHKIVPINEGVLMTDLVTYQPPFGFLGRLANHLIIRKKLAEIFEYRRNVLYNLFGAS